MRDGETKFMCIKKCWKQRRVCVLNEGVLDLF